MKVTPELLAELLMEENKIIVLCLYFEYNNGNTKQFACLATKSEMIYSELCPN